MAAKIEDQSVEAMAVKKCEKSDEIGFVRAGAVTDDHSVRRPDITKKPAGQLQPVLSFKRNRFNIQASVIV